MSNTFTGLNVMQSDIDRFRSRVISQVDSLKQLHATQISPEDMVTSRVKAVDLILKDVWTLFFRNQDKSNEHTSLIAVGGYGREELNPYSDIDILILQSNENHALIEQRIKPLIRFLWDIGFEIGSSVRSLNECVRQARGDVTVMTNLLEGRHCAGSLQLFEQLRDKLQNSKIWPAKKFFRAKVKEQELRHHKFADTAYNLEPNIKDGPGGLRDIHTIAWIAMRQFGTRSLHELVTRGFLSEDEYQILISGRNYLWKLRNELHMMLDRREDRLLFSHQLQLAKRFGYLDDSRNIAVEKLMKGYFRTVKELRHINSMLLQHFDESFLTRKRWTRKRINDQFLTVDGYLDFADSALVKKNPKLLIELCMLYHLDANVRGVRASALRLMRSKKELIDAQIRSDTAVHSMLLQLFNKPDRIFQTLTLMDDTGILGQLIPDFKKITGQLQYDLFHVYTVDAHLLNVVWHLQQLTKSAKTQELKFAREAMKRVVKPERLFIAALFHDIAKGQDGDHSEIGETVSYEFCKRVGMSEYDSHSVSWLVKHHLLMSFTSQKKNLNDPKVITRFAEIVGNQDYLDHLYLLTIADMRGTGPTVWNDWKGQMLTQLYLETSRSLLMDTPPHEKLEPRIEEIKSDVLSIVGRQPKLTSAAKNFWQYMEDDYFLSNDANTLAWHIGECAILSAVDLPLVSFRVHPSIKVIQIFILAPNSEKLFCVIAGALDRCYLNVLDARNHPLQTGLTAFTFVVLARDAVDGASGHNLDAFQFEVRKSMIEQRFDHTPSTIAPDRVARHLSFPANVIFYASPGNDYTIMEISARDRPGLLYLVVRTLLNHKLLLLSAKITTIGARVEDVFFLIDRDGHPLNDVSAQQSLRNEILKSLETTQSSQSLRRKRNSHARS